MSVVLEYALHIRTVCEANARGHWRVKAARNKAIKNSAWIITQTTAGFRAIDWRAAKAISVTMSRHTSGKPDDDGAVSAVKYVRDGIAAAMGIDDGDPRFTWIVKQEKAPPKKQFVWIRIEVMQ